MKATMYLFALTFVLLSLANPVQAVDDGCRADALHSAPGMEVTPVDVYLSQAHAMEAQRNWTGAVAVTGEAIAWYPDNPALHCISGYALRKLGRYPEAVEQVSRAMVFDQKPVRFANRGYSYLALGNFAAALADADAGISRDPAYPATYAVQALALHAMGRDTGALLAVDRALAIEPGSAHYWHIKGRILATAGNCTGAGEALEQSLSLDPHYDPPWPGFASARTDLEILGSTCRGSPAMA